MLEIPSEIVTRRAGRVLVIPGSGLSADSGIPTFRGSEGYWRKFDPRQLATQEAFDRDPALVWQWYRERRTGIRAAQPNAAHTALARLGAVAREHLIVTQNVDDLHERAGTSADHLVHIHGDIFVSRCTRCTFDTREDWPDMPVPACPTCRAPLRPGVVWFDEYLDPRNVARVERFLSRGSIDLVIAIGTTASFGYILDWAARGGRLVEINPEPALADHADWIFRGRAADVMPALLN